MKATAVSTILATAALGSAAFMFNPEVQMKAVLAPMLIAAVGIILSVIGIFTVRTREGASMKQLLRSLGFGVNLSAVLIAVASFAILYLLDMPNWGWIAGSVVIGLIANQLKPDDALSELSGIKSTVRKYNGKFVVLWHNSYFSFENRKTLAVYKEILKESYLDSAR